MRRSPARTVSRCAIILALGVLCAGGIFIRHFRFKAPQDSDQTGYRAPLPVADDLTWTNVSHDSEHTQHSSLAQITRQNVSHLRVAWIFHMGDAALRPMAALQKAKTQTTPILAAGHLVLCTPFNRVIALDPQSGQIVWTYDSHLSSDTIRKEGFNCRGLAQWHDPAAPPEHAERLFMATNDRRVIALDATSGHLIAEFGTAGEVQLPLSGPLASPTELQLSSAPAVVGNIVVIGSASGDNRRVEAPWGTVYALDARTGSIRWTFDPIPREFDPIASPTWAGRSASYTGQANVWGSITVDPDRDLVFLPTSSASPDFYGGLRKGENLYSDSLVAIRATTGSVLWHFQTVHHDLWDYDIPAGPALITMNGVPALVFATKNGFLFVLNRETGTSLTPIEERIVPASNTPGEKASPRQPYSVGEPVLVPQSISSSDAFGILLFDRLACRRAISQARNQGMFTPPSVDGSLIVPGDLGGANWGGVAVDPGTNTAIVNTSRLLMKVTLIPANVAAQDPRVAESLTGTSGARVYPQEGAPYGVKREAVLSPLGMPCNPPPWGTLAAVDLGSGRLLWESTLGTTKGMAPFGLAFKWGTPNLGGPMITDGGLVFIGAAMDNYLRAFDSHSGAELWAGELPAGGQATPMTYAIGGKQYVVIAAGGHPVLGTTLGDSIVAFSLP